MLRWLLKRGLDVESNFIGLLGWRRAARLYAVGLLVALALVIVANVLTDPSIGSGVMIVTGFVAYGVLGVNAWFLRTLIADLSLTRSENNRRISPYLLIDELRELPGGEFRVALMNAGAGVAAGVIVDVFVDHAPTNDRMKSVGFTIDGDSTSTQLPDGADPLIRAHRGRRPAAEPQWSGAIDTTQGTWQIGSWTRYQLPPLSMVVRLQCRDQEGRRHVRVYVWTESDEAEIMELPFGTYPPGSMAPPTLPFGALEMYAMTREFLRTSEPLI